MELQWIPVHVGIGSNDTADKSAKEATEWRLKKLRREGTREKNTSLTYAKV